MNLVFAITEVGRAVSILTTGRARILDRLVSARDEALSHVQREDIPEHLRNQFDAIITQAAKLDALTEDEGVSLAKAIEDLAGPLDDEMPFE